MNPGGDSASDATLAYDVDEPGAGGRQTQQVTIDRVCAIIATVLRLERIAPDDNLFDLGLNSLLVLDTVARLEAAFGVEVPIVAVFDRPTARELSQVVAAQPVPCP